MPRIGRRGAALLLATLVGVCSVLSGCTTPRQLSDSMVRAAQPTAAIQAGASQAGASQAGPIQQVRGVTPPAQDKPALGEHGLGAHELPAPRPWTPAIAEGPFDVGIPRELQKVAHPTYVIEPPDILLVDAARLIPRPPYRVEPLDALAIQVTNTLPKAPIEGIYPVDPSGSVDLGFTYGSVKLHGQTLKEVKQSIADHLKEKLKPPFDVYVSLAETKATQQVRGEHLVRQDGTIGLGTYGSVYVTGMTIAEARAAIEHHLSKFLFEPKVSVDVGGFNSHVYFVIFDFPAAGGQAIYRRPITGNETVLDALSDYGLKAGGLPAGVSKHRIWVARPTLASAGHAQILPVDWNAITRSGDPATNYQLLPGDRIYVGQDHLLAVDIALSRIFSPIERMFGITLFGTSVVQNFRNNNGINGGVR
jgi:polysaccharide export outer membrane protein